MTRTATRGWLAQRSSARPTDAATPSSAGPRWCRLAERQHRGECPRRRAGHSRQAACLRHRNPIIVAGPTTLHRRRSLEGNHGIRALRHHRPGGNPHRLTRRKRARNGCPARASPTTSSSAAGPATTAKPSIAELSKGGTSSVLVTSSASTRPSAGVQRHRLVPEPRVTASSTRRRASSIVIRSLTGAIFSEIRAAVRRFRRYDRLRVTPIRGPLARLERSRDELAKQWLVRLIERASLDEIRELPDRAIARELPELISGIALRSRTATAILRPDEGAGGAGSALAALRSGRGARRARADVARDVAALQSVLLHALRDELEDDPSVRRGGRALVEATGGDPGRGHGGARARRARASSSRRPTPTRSPASATCARSSASSRPCWTSASATSTRSRSS